MQKQSFRFSGLYCRIRLAKLTNHSAYYLRDIIISFYQHWFVTWGSSDRNLKLTVSLNYCMCTCMHPLTSISVVASESAFWAALVSSSWAAHWVSNMSISSLSRSTVCVNLSTRRSCKKVNSKYLFLQWIQYPVIKKNQKQNKTWQAFI